MKRTCFFLTLSLVCGVFLTATSSIAWLCGISVGFGVLALFCFLRRKKDAGWLCFSAFLGLFAGLFLFTFQFNAYNKKVTALPTDTPVTISGRITASSVTSQGKPRFTLKYKTTDGVVLRLYLYPTGNSTLSVGDVITLPAHVTPPTPAKNFGESDFRLYMMAKRVHGSVFCESDAITKTGRDFSFRRPADALYALRQQLASTIKRHTEADVRGFLLALLSGDTSSLYQEQRDALQRSGLSHIVAVSGMHLQILIQAAAALFYVLKMRRRYVTAFLFLVLSWFLVFFTGASASVLRSALMISVFIFSQLFRKENDGLTALAISVLILCLINAAIVFDVGFQLSCTATLAILLFSSLIEKRLWFLPVFLQRTAAMSIAATIGFFLPAIYQFGTISVLSIGANLLVGPIIAPLLVCGFLATFLGSVPYIGSFLFFLVRNAIRYILRVASFFASLPFAQLSLPRPTLLTSAAFLFFAASFYFLLCKKRRQTVWTCNLALFFIVLHITASFLSPTQITFLHVGNGDCAVISHRGTHILIDSGGSTFQDVAADTLLPYLRREGIDKIDAAFLTHYHTDHGAAFLPLLQGGYIRRLILPNHANSTLKAALFSAAIASGTEIILAKDKDVFYLSDMELAAFDTACGDEENDGLVYRLTSYNARVLFTGDITKNGERKLVYSGADIDCDILKVPHHGSNTSGTTEFAAAVSPSVTVISCGKNNFGHPHKETLSLYADTQIYRTDLCGSVRISIRKNGDWHATTKIQNHTE